MSETRQPRPLSFGRYLVGAAAFVAAVLALFEPEGSRGLDLPGRIAFWGAHAFVGVGLFAMTQRVLGAVPGSRRLGPWVRTALAGALGGLLLSPIAYLLESGFGIADTDAPTSLALAVADEALAVVPSAAVVWLAMNAPWLLRLRLASARPATPASPAATQPAPTPEARSPAIDVDDLHGADPGRSFLDLLPEALGPDLVSLSSELHYLRVRTRRGETLILHRLRDAVEILGDARGMQVHRSHWIAADQVRQVRRRGDGAVCLMSDGTRVPVSRRYRRSVLERFGERSTLGNREVE